MRVHACAPDVCVRVQLTPCVCRGAQSWLSESVSKTRREEDREVQDNLARFEKLKKQMTELSALSTKWADLQAEMLHTEHEIALQLKEMGVHETACPNGGRSMGSCMTSAGVLLSKTCKDKENLVANCAAFAANMDSFMQTALEDLSASVKRYDATRRDYLSAEEVLNTSVSARKDPEKQRILRYYKQSCKIAFETFTPKQLEESRIVPRSLTRLCGRALLFSLVLLCVAERTSTRRQTHTSTLAGR